MTREFTSQFPNDPLGAAKDAASEVKKSVSDLASDARDKATQVANSVAESANRQREKAAKGLHKAASVIDSAGPRASEAAHKVAQGLDGTASYLEDHGLSDMGDDVLGVFRRYPAQALLSSLAIGFLLGRTLRR